MINWLTDHIEIIHCEGLLDEMLKHNPYSFSSRKAERIYNLCIDNGKHELARKILLLHGESPKSDLVIAHTLALLAEKNIKQ